MPLQEKLLAAVMAMNDKVGNIADLFLKHTESDDGVLKNIKELLRKLPSEILKESKDRDERLLEVLDKAIGSLEALKTQHDDQKSRDELKIQLLGDLKKGQNDLKKGQDNLKDDLKKCLDDIKKGQDDLKDDLKKCLDEIKKGQDDQHRESMLKYERMIQAFETNNKLLQTLVNLQTNTPAEASRDKDGDSARLHSGPSRPSPRRASEGSGEAGPGNSRTLFRAKRSQSTE